MFPFRTTVTLHGVPVVTLALIAINVALFLYLTNLPHWQQIEFIYRYALVPAAYSHPAAARAAGIDPEGLLPLISNTFLHGGWLHIIANMWTLWLFGAPVEDRLGKWRFLLLYLACGAAGSITHLAFNLHSPVPALGASGAIAGVLGTFTVLFPTARVALVVPILFYPLIFHLPAMVFTALWFGLQIVQGLTTVAVGAVGGIAWWAHIGGFALGVAVALRILRLRRRHRPGPWLR